MHFSCEARSYVFAANAARIVGGHDDLSVTSVFGAIVVTPPTLMPITAVFRNTSNVRLLPYERRNRETFPKWQLTKCELCELPGKIYQAGN